MSVWRLVKLEILEREIGAQIQQREPAFGGIVDEWVRPTAIGL
jgi:hypothetical protein